MAKIQSVSTSIVQATASEESRKRIELSSSDLKYLLIDAIQKGLLFPNHKQSQVINFSIIQHLKTSLSRTLDFFFPLAGRLATTQNDDKTVTYFIECNNAGAHFVHAIAENVTISDILEPIYVPPIVHSFFPLNGCKNHDGVSKPLLAVQVTELADGIFIGCSVNHVVADGTTFWNFINSWSEISRGSDKISRSPVFEHWIRESYCPISLPISIIKTDEEFTSPQLQERIFHLSKQNIRNLKAKANAESRIDKISSLQSIMAHVWRSVIRNRRLDLNEETNFYFAIGVRSRTLKSQLPKDYFGNAVQSGVVTMRVKELLEDHGLGNAAFQMNKVIECHTEDNIRNNIECWIKNPQLLILARNVIFLSSSPRFDVYGNDFGWGRPIAVRSGVGNKFYGIITVFPGVEEGSMDISVCILPEVLYAMENDFEFIEAFS